jgi:uncharacterized protein with von Willebrand factor type A (vWA) domain
VASGAAPGARLEENLIRFVHVLRRLGIPVNPAETLDGLAALGLVDLGDRAAVKAALRATLVKTEPHGSLFDRAFDLFFAPPEEREEAVARRRRARLERQERLERARTELVFQGELLELTPEQLEAYTRLGEAQREKLREFLAESSAGHNVDASFQPLIESIVRGHLDRWRRNLDVERRLEDHLSGDEEIDTVVEGALGGSDTDPLVHLDMKDIQDADLARATQVIRRLARRLATRLSRRYRDSRRRRRLNMRRTIRSNIRYGGVLFDLRYRERRRARPRLLLVADVSGSMARYTAFTLEFIFGLSAAVSGVEAFVFSEQLERVSDSRLAVAPAGADAGGRHTAGGGHSGGGGHTAGGGHTGGGRSSAGAADTRSGLSAAAAQIVRQSRVWGKGTDLGRALETLVDEHERLLTRDTVLIIVSDTKTLGAGKAAALLGRIRPRVRGVLWLNTLPREEWDEHRSVVLFARHSDMHECYTLAHLERVIRVGVGQHFRPA